jgi:Tol biopolymer transport system component
MRPLLTFLIGLLAIAAITAGAAARPLGTNGQLTFARVNPALGDTQAYVVNPDGTGERLIQGPTAVGEVPRWFSDGAHIATCCDSPGGGSRIINPDDGTFRDVDGQFPGLFNPCGSPSPDGTLLLCETFSDDGSQNGIHTIRSADGGGFTQITSNPGGDDVPGSWSPNGSRIVFQRNDPDGNPEGLFVVNANGSGLKRILPPTVSANCCTFNWSPQGNEIAFSRHATPDVHSSLWVVHSDGSGLRPLPVPSGSGCGGANSDAAAIGCLEPAWSPDGRKVAFAGGLDLDTDGEIYTMNLDGTGLRQVTHTGGSQSPDWGTHPLTP